METDVEQLKTEINEDMAGTGYGARVKVVSGKCFVVLSDDKGRTVEYFFNRKQWGLWRDGYKHGSRRVKVAQGFGVAIVDGDAGDEIEVAF